MYNNPYLPNFTMNQQNMYDRIDNQIAQLQGLKDQLKNNPIQPTNQQPAINQTFQLAPNGNNGIKYVNSIEDVNKENVFVDTPFFNKDLTMLWLKNSNGDIKAYELNEIIQKDEKDLQIEFLTARLNQLEGMIINEQSNSNDNAKQNTANTTTNDEPIREPIEKSKSTSISRVSTSKKK
jgi:hypothetical protein